MTQAQIIVLATPVFLALIVVEFTIGRLRGRDTYVSGNPAAFFPTPMRLPTMRPIDNDTKAMRWARASVGDWG